MSLNMGMSMSKTGFRLMKPLDPALHLALK